MQLDFLPSPGFIPSGHRLRAELTKACSFVEVQASLQGGTVDSAATLIATLEAAITALTPLVPAEGP